MINWDEQTATLFPDSIKLLFLSFLFESVRRYTNFSVKDKSKGREDRKILIFLPQWLEHSSLFQNRK